MTVREIRVFIWLKRSEINKSKGDSCIHLVKTVKLIGGAAQRVQSGDSELST